MQSKFLSLWPWFIVATTVIAFLSIIIFFMIDGQSSQNFIDIESLASIQGVIVFEEPASFGLPVRLKIPKINIDSVVEYVGLTAGGAMDIPENQNNVAWFELGQRPGNSGSAVIAGHYGLKDGRPSVFDDLYKLRKGDKLYVEDDKGIIVSFVVRESRRYDPNADVSSVFSSNDDKSHLNLITCEGDWDKTQKTYSKRLVVFTDKE